MTERIPKGIVFAAIVVGMLGAIWFAYERPGYFVNQSNLAALLFLELILGSIWFYRRAFFPVTIAVFILAGSNLPGVGGWTLARWILLAVGALVGTIIVLKERRFDYGVYHATAVFAVLAALVSAAVSRYSVVSGLKVLSLCLLFIYAATGVRVAVAGRENRFFSGLLLGCEIFVGIVAGFYLFGRGILGNPNSTGAVMGVVAAPVLLWGILLKQHVVSCRRRLIFFAIAMYLTVASQARAGMLAAFIACGLLCLGLRKYALLMQGFVVFAVLVAGGAIAQPDAFSRAISGFTADVVFKGKDPAKGVLGSRTSPWQDTMDSIQEHFWFGTGFGTSDKGADAGTNYSKVETGATSTEHGSSYLAIAAWVGIAGLLPFSLLVGILSAKVVQTLRWMLRTGDPHHGAVPLAIVIVAGLVHAGFEDWLFAPGYHLCVFFWSMAFIFVDQAALLNVSRSSIPVWSRARVIPPQFSSVVAPK